jgi:O-antigen/teichoic acid export membrane protein
VTGVIGKARALRHSDRHLADIAGSILGSNVVTSVIGIVFWMLAGRGLTKASMGTLGAATAAMMFIGVVGSLGLGPLLISQLPPRSAAERWELFAVATGASALASGALGGLFAAVAAETGRTWAPLHPFGASWWWMVLGCALTGVSGVLDQAMLVVGNPMAQVWRNLLASIWKVLVLAVAYLAASVSVALGLGAWSTGLLLGSVVAIRAAARQMPGERRVSPARSWQVIREHALDAMSHQSVNLALTVTVMAMPAVIAWALSPDENGIYTAMRLATMFPFMVPYALAFSLFAASAHQGELDEARSRRVLLTALGVSLGLYLVIFVAAWPALWLFGRQYADEGVTLLRVMAAAGPLMVFKDQYIAHVRARRQVKTIVPLVTLSAVLELGLALVGAIVGQLMGAMVGWIVALAIEAIYVAPKLQWRRPAVAPAEPVNVQPEVAP